MKASGASASPPARDRRAAGALRFLLSEHLRPYRTSVIVLVFLQLIQTGALLYLPTINAEIIDHGVIAGDVKYVVQRGGLMLAVTVLQVMSLLTAVGCGARVATSVGRDVRAAVFAKVMSFSAREVGQFGTPSLVTRTTNDVQQIQALVLAIFTMFVSAPAMAIGAVILALRQDVPLSMVVLAVIPVVGFLMALIVRRVTPLFRLMQHWVDVVNRILREQITGARVVRAFTREEYERRRFERTNEQLANVAVRSGRLTAMMLPLAATTVNLIAVPVVWLAAYRVDSGSMSIGPLTAFLGYLTLILVAVVTATNMFMMVPRAEVCADRIQEVLRTPCTLLLPAVPVQVLPAPGHIDLVEVTFSYPGAEEPVLNGVNMIARPGEVTAIVGSTGAGKSTLLALIARQVSATGGEVWVGGVDVQSLSPAVHAATVGLVPQNSVLFTGTVGDNLRFGLPDVTDDQLWRALEIAQARNFVAALKGGLQAEVSQGGRNFSGGQRQRLAIARTLVRQPSVYLFDDSFSALDHATEAQLRAALIQETANACLVVVAQRVSTIRQADRIVVLEAGRIVGTGRHSELLENTPIYREIVNSQTFVGTLA